MAKQTTKISRAKNGTRSASAVQRKVQEHKARFVPVDNSRAPHGNPWSATMGPLIDVSTLTVPMTEYLKLSDEMNTWRRRALAAEEQNTRSGDVLGEGRFFVTKGKKSPSGLEVG